MGRSLKLKQGETKSKGNVLALSGLWAVGRQPALAGADQKEASRLQPIPGPGFFPHPAAGWLPGLCAFWAGEKLHSQAGSGRHLTYQRSKGHWGRIHSELCPAFCCLSQSQMAFD